MPAAPEARATSVAATSRLWNRIERGLSLVSSDVQALPEYVEQWGSLEEGPRVTLSLEWDHSMADYLTELDEYYRAGQMAAEQATRYRDLLARLKEALPLVDQLSFWRPLVCLDP